MPTTSAQGSQINSTNAADNKTSSFQFPSTTASTALSGNQATNNTTATDKQTSNLFGSQTNSQPKTTNNIFGSQAAAPSTQAPTSSLNASTSAGSVTTQAPTSNLFGEKRSSASENQFSAQAPISTQPTISTTNVLGEKVSEPASTSGVPVSSSTVNALGSSTNIQANASNDKKNEHVVKEYDLNPNQTVGEFMAEQLKRLQQLQSHYNTKSAELFEIDNKVKLDGGKINRIYKTLEQLENSQNTIINYLDYMEKEQKEIETILLEGERSFQNAYALRDSYKKSESSTLTSAAVIKDLEREKLYSMVDIINHRAIEATKDLSELASASNEMMSKIFEGIDPSLRQNVDGFKYESKLTRNIVREMKKEASIMGFKNEQ
ncbi:hypothetical protein K502DRAFT_364594 [Neoconidiobolus thromboides FSU 785]|nr:hypothetical protein K502DRAFT_364594 [Neoconidiobolus thromboides FSU 785]